MEVEKLHIDNASQVLALVLGQKDNLSPELINAYSEAGVSHVLALSGLHLAVFCCLFYPIILYIRHRQAHGKAGWQSWLAATAIVSCLWWYVSVAGAPMSLVRAAAMYSLGIFCFCLNVRLPLWKILLLSMMCIALLMPSSITDIGFQLSCSAIMGIATLGTLEFRTKTSAPWYQSILKFLRITLACQLFTTPISLYYFHSFAPLSLLLSPIIIPLVTITLYLSFPLVAMAYFDVHCSPLAWLVDKLLDIQNIIIEYSANHISAIHGIHFSFFLVVLSYIILLAVCYLLWQKQHDAEPLRL